MPDLTLYEQDVELIRDALGDYNASMRKRANERIVDDSVYDDIKETERLSDLLLDRLVQRLHPKRS
jgi:hypothetical protein